MKDGGKKVQKYFRVARLPCCWMITAAAPPFALKQPTRSDVFLYIWVTPKALHNTWFIYRNVMQMKEC